MKNTKTTYRFYAAWEYEKEEQKLNEASQKGLQLFKGGCFHSKFIRDDSVRYIYQLDYNPKIADFERYREIFEEQGWEYINSTYNGWHYFRKLYREGMEESEAHIYTDRQSLYEMQNRWLRMVTIFDLLYIAMSVIYLYSGITEESHSMVAEGIIMGLFALTFSLGIISIRQKRSGKKGKFIIPMQIAFPAAILLLLFVLVINGFGWDWNVIHEEKFSLIASENNKLPSGSFTIEKGGKYKIDLDVHIDNGTMTVSIKDSSGKVVFKESGGDFSVDNRKIKLEEDKYQTSYDYKFNDYDPEKAKIYVEMEIKK
jgi:hypothetical protein